MSGPGTRQCSLSLVLTAPWPWACMLPDFRVEQKCLALCCRRSLEEKGIRVSFFFLLKLVSWEAKCRPEPTQAFLETGSIIEPSEVSRPGDVMHVKLAIMSMSGPQTSSNPKQNIHFVVKIRL